MSWALLVYAIDVLSTDGTYFGWGILFMMSVIAYIIMRVQLMYEEEKATSTYHHFTIGKHLVLAKPWNGFEVGQHLIVCEIHSTNNDYVQIKDPNGSTSGWLKKIHLAEVVAPEGEKKEVRDYLKPIRRLFATFIVICGLGIGYANFMPTQDTAYKMLAAYVGQTVVETPEVRQTAGNAIDFLNKAIKTYSEKLDATAAEETAAKAKATKEGEK